MDVETSLANVVGGGDEMSRESSVDYFSLRS